MTHSVIYHEYLRIYRPRNMTCLYSQVK